MRTCANCGAHQPDEAAFCDECGAPLRSAQAVVSPVPVPVQGRTVMASSVCPTCGAQVSLQNPFCTNCGAALREVSHPVSIPSFEDGDATVVAGSPAPPLVPAVTDDGGGSMVPQGEGAKTVVEGLTCSQCGAILQVGSAYCDQCGAPVGARSGPPADSVQAQVPELFANEGQYQGSRTVMVGAPTWEPPVPLPAPVVTGRLVVQATGAVLSLPVGKIELLIGREDPINGIFPDVDLTDHSGDEGGVSRKHARLTVQGGQFAIEDLNSVNGTYVNGARLAFGEQCALSDGDQIRLGRVTLAFRVL